MPDSLQMAIDKLIATPVSNAELLTWTFTGEGRFVDESARQLCLEEGTPSKGVGIFSPKSYAGDVVLRYKVMPLTGATVLVNLLAMSDAGESQELTLPKDYDGSMGPVLSTENYFVAFRNSPHATAPFIRKNPGYTELAIAERDEMIPGVYYDVEVGRVGETIFLKVDGKMIVQTVDAAVLAGGHVGIRLRGTAGHPAVCLLRDLTVLSTQ